MNPHGDSARERLDVLVQRLAGVTRSKAQGLIATGQVRGADGEVLRRPGQRLPEDTVLTIAEPQRYVSRGGEKLAAAIAHFHPMLAGRSAIDVGASTGGFTDCLLQHGVARVVALDVGYGQLAWSLRQDPRVHVLERTNIRALEPGSLPFVPDLFVIDCSFISLRLVLPAVLPHLARPAEGIVLIKPQFEAGREQVGKGGVVRDEAVREATVGRVSDSAAGLGFEVRGVLPSPVLGPAGNREFLAWLYLPDTSFTK